MFHDYFFTEAVLSLFFPEEALISEVLGAQGRKLVTECPPRYYR